MGDCRQIAVRCDDSRVLVGPDNGLLSLAWERAGGAVEAIDVSRSQHRLEPLSATFHGRDLFVPVAAQLAVSASDPIPKAMPGAPSCGRAPAAAAVTIEGIPRACKSAALNTDEL